MFHILGTHKMYTVFLLIYVEAFISKKVFRAAFIRVRPLFLFYFLSTF